MDEAALSEHFNRIGLPPEACEYLIDLWRVIQILDDVADGQENSQASTVAWAIFARIPLNKFYQQSFMSLQPLLTMQLIKWEAANTAEQSGAADERSYVWRAGYYEIVSMACHLCGVEPGQALSLYGETFASYRKEFPCPVH